MTEDKTTPQVIYTTSLNARFFKLICGLTLMGIIVWMCFDADRRYFYLILFFAGLVGLLFIIDFLLPLEISFTAGSLVVRKLFSKQTIQFKDLKKIEVRPLLVAEQLPLVDSDTPVPELHGLFLEISFRDHADRNRIKNFKVFEGKKQLCDQVGQQIRELQNSLPGISSE